MSNSRTIAVRLTPRASADRVGVVRILPNGVEMLTVYVTAPPDKNKANEAMIHLLAKHFGVPKFRLTITHGATNRNKLVKIQ